MSGTVTCWACGGSGTYTTKSGRSATCGVRGGSGTRPAEEKK